MIYNITFLVIGLSVGIVATWFIRKYKYELIKNIPDDEKDKLKIEIQELTSTAVRLEERISNSEKSQSILREELTQEREKLSVSEKNFSQMLSENKFLKEKLLEQKEDVTNLQNKFKEEFSNLANKILEDKSKRFTEQNKANLDVLLKPLGEKIKDFQQKVEETYDKESKQRFSLEKEIKTMQELNERMTKDAQNLTNALKGESKTQGNWGEMILETILEKSGLQKGIHFNIQQSMISKDGKRLQPDVIINLPENKTVILDSKVSLTAYERYYSSDDKEEKKSALKAHISSVKSHIKELSVKEYQNLEDLNTPDFVIMFIPIEPAFGLALYGEPNLLSEAMSKNVIAVSPSTLLATLKIISSLWKLDNQNKNVNEIARQSGALYDKFCGFVNDLQDIGKKIDGVKKSYEGAFNKLQSGKGNLIRSSERLRELGAKTTKRLPEKLTEEN